VPKTAVIDKVLTKLLQKENGAVFCLAWYTLVLCVCPPEWQINVFISTGYKFETFTCTACP